MRNAVLLFLFVPLFCGAQPGIVKSVDTTSWLWYYFGGDGSPSTKEVAVDKSGNLYSSSWYSIYKTRPNMSTELFAGSYSEGTFAIDGGPATAGSVNADVFGKIVVDSIGNVFFTESSRSKVRRVDTNGIIWTVAGTGVGGYSGDGGAATSAQLRRPAGIDIDNYGNVYVGDSNNIRKISASGVITTIAGNGTVDVITDGMPATDAQIGMIYDLGVDAAGNLFFLNDSIIGKVDVAGHIWKVTNTPGPTTYMSDYFLPTLPFGEDSPATTGVSNGVGNIDVDAAGNVYLACISNNCIRKVHSNGIISTIAGIPHEDSVYWSVESHSWPDENALSTSVTTSAPAWVSVHPSGDVYFGVQKFFNYGRFYKINYTPSFSADSFSVYTIPTCIGVDHYFRTNTFLSSYTVKSYYGDGTESSAVLASDVDGAGGTSVSHVYSAPGYYSVRHVLYDDTTAVDSISYTHHYQLCNNVFGKLFYDDNGNCGFDTASELYSHTPVAIRVDSNGVPVDTIAATSGFYYKAYGNPTDVYAFRVISAADSVHIVCPISGILSKTLTAVVDDGATLIFPLTCTSTSGFDLTCSSSARTGRHAQRFEVWSNNKRCIPTDATVTMHFNPKYEFLDAIPWPTTLSGNVATWDFSELSYRHPYKHIVVQLERDTALPWLMPGDTVNTKIIITPTAGDGDTTNNVINRVDVVRSSYDPNEITVSPTGNILNGTELQYTVHFENMGNDTAHNVHVMDTLSNDVDMSSLRIVMASAVMNTVFIREGGYNVVKFDFPNIKLLDSSHHGLSDGMVIYTVKAKTGLAHGTPITNRAGIYFDDNEVVMTNTALNHILVPTINVSPAANPICYTDTARFTATAISLKQPYYHWMVNGVHVGGNSPAYEAVGLANGSVVKCLLYNPAHDTVITESNPVVVMVETAPAAGSITGAGTVCESASVMLGATVPGGAWSAGGGASVSGGVVSGIAPGVSTISYAVTNTCGTAVATKNITVNPLPTAGTITAASIVCPGATAPLVSTVPGGAWSVSGGHATISGGVLTGTSAGIATVSYMVTNGCGVAVATHIMTVNALPIAGSISGVSGVCVGGTILLSAGVPGGIWSAGAGAGVSGGSVLGLVAGSTTISYSVTNICGTATATHNITVNPLPAAGSISGAGVVCESATETLTATAPGGAWSASSGAATVSSGVVTGVAAGSVTVTYTVNNSCGTDMATHAMTVNPAPVAGSITGAAVVCESASETLTASVPGGAWSAGGGVSVSGGVVTGVSAGLTTISYAVTNSCGTAVATHNMTVNPLPTVGTLAGAGTVCMGAAETLTASEPGGTWSVSGGAGVSGGLVTGFSAGAVTVSYTVTNGCGTDIATHPMMVVAPPVAGTIAGAGVVCENAQETLVASVPGGTWSTGNSNVSVSGGVVMGVWTGTTTISYTVTNACGVAVATHEMTVNPLPDAGSITGPASVCTGRQVTLTSTVAGGVWSSPAATATVASGLVTGVVAGATVVSYTVSNSCGAAIATHNITVETLPVVSPITGPDMVCVGQSVLLSNATAGGNWEAENDKVTVTGGVVNGVTAGESAVLYRLVNACGTSLAGHAMTVTPKPEAGTITGAEQVYAGESVTLAATKPGGVWTSSNGNAVVENGTVSGRAAGDVVILYTVTNPCGSDVAQKDVKVLGDAGPTLLPNPTRSVLTIRANGRQYQSLIITDAAGRQVYSGAFTGSETTVDVRVLPAGNYQVKLVGDKYTAVEQFTKL